MSELTGRAGEQSPFIGPSLDGSRRASRSSALTRGRRTRAHPLLLKRKAAARYCGFSLATWDRMSAAGLNPEGLKIGGSRMFRRDELRAWVRHNCPPRREWVVIWENLQKQEQRRR